MLTLYEVLAWEKFVQVLAIQQLNCQHLYIWQISIHVGSVIGVGQMLANQLTPYLLSAEPDKVFHPYIVHSNYIFIAHTYFVHKKNIVPWFCFLLVIYISTYYLKTQHLKDFWRKSLFLRSFAFDMYTVFKHSADLSYR